MGLAWRDYEHISVAILVLSFAQFEREMIADRTRDKMEAARRKGKWVAADRRWVAISPSAEENL